MAEVKGVVEVFNREPPNGKMTFEEFLAWCDEDTLAEWLGGEVQMVSPASNIHQDLARFLTSVLSIFVGVHQLGAIRPAPFTMLLPKVVSGREPDLMFVTTDHLDRLRDTYLDGPADLVVEIVSPSSIGRDRGEKFVEYEVGGVSEYWPLYPDRRMAEFYHLSEDGHYRMEPVGTEGIFRSQVVEGFWLKVEWLWQRPLPLELDVLREQGVI